MKIALDTNILIEIERTNDEIKKKIYLLTKEYGNNVFVTAPSISEFIYGVIKRGKNKDNAIKLINDYKIINTSKTSSFILAELKHELEKQGIIISEFDLMIASICIAEGKLLVTLDKDFSQIPRLNVVVLEE